MAFDHALTNRNIGLGIGANNNDSTHTTKGINILHNMLERLLQGCAAAARAPWQMHFSVLWLLDKKNGKTGPAALRTIHGIPSPSKLLLTTIFEKAADELNLTPPDNVYHCKGRRKEAAIAIQILCGLRLQTANITYIRNFRDTHNAYASISH